ncbi:carbamoyltransferase C-terminal domain-containing protein [Candidatus Omnitrophota bacterium]
MHILALHEDSNANATLFRDGKILFSVAEERFTRVKHQGGFPKESLKFILEKFAISLDDIDVVLCGNKYHPLPRILGDRFPTFEHSFLGPSQKLSLYYQHALYKSKLLRTLVEKLNRSVLKRKFGKPVSMVDHHAAHAYSAYMTSGFDEAVTITTDNYGDGLSSAVFVCKNGKCSMIQSSSALNSPGQYYGELAQLLGFHPLMAGKMTGLAAYGDPHKAYGLVKGLFGLTEDKKDFVLPSLFFKSVSGNVFRKLKEYKKEDVAAAAQRRFEEVMLEYVTEAIKSAGSSNVALAGGIYGNVRLNQKISELDTVNEVFVHPGMSDQGISMGVGLKYLALNGNLKPFRLKNVYFGSRYNNKDIESALKGSGTDFEYCEDIEKKVANILSEGKVVARYADGLEYGPRALGNRSILYQTTDRSVNDWLNKKLNRSEFMPFAPVTLDEYAEKCYKNVAKGKYTARFMTISFDCTELMKEMSPGVIHLDGTARPQILNEESNPSYYRILKEYHKITGIPSLINTSFNMHEEPIVNTPEEAIRAFKAAGLDYLAAGNYLIKK